MPQNVRFLEASKFEEANAKMFLVGGFSKRADVLESVGVASPYISAILQIQSFYIAANEIALARDLDPDKPRHLKKVTETV